MTKRHAAEVMALDVQVWARKHNQPVTLALCEERVSEWRGPNYAGTFKAQAALIANPKTVLRLALKGA